MAKKKAVKPTAAQAKEIKGKLQKQYPQMYNPNLSAHEKKAYDKLKKADRAGILKTVGAKMKKIYRSK